MVTYVFWPLSVAANSSQPARVIRPGLSPRSSLVIAPLQYGVLTYLISRTSTAWGTVEKSIQSYQVSIPMRTTVQKSPPMRQRMRRNNFPSQWSTSSRSGFGMSFASAIFLPSTCGGVCLGASFGTCSIRRSCRSMRRHRSRGGFQQLGDGGRSAHGRSVSHTPVEHVAGGERGRRSGLD